MNVFKSPKQLVQEELVMLRSKIVIGLDYLVKIRFHQLENHVYVSELSTGWWQHDVFNLHNIGVAKEPQQLDLSKDASSIRNMLKHIIDLLNCHPFPGVGINRRPNHAIAPFPDHLLYLILTRLAVLRKKLLVQHTLHHQKQTHPLLQTCYIHPSRVITIKHDHHETEKSV